MVFNTATVGAAVTPTVLETCVTHYMNRKSRKEKPTADISYHIGLLLIRRFLLYASHHTVDDIQGFTGQWVPSPRWVKTEDINIPDEYITKAAQYLTKELGESGLEQIGGPTWWQWRRKELPLRAEWIEMRKDFNARKQLKESCKRVILYVHGGAYFFGSVDEHRYQLQRHARKLNARVFAPRYRLAPQFPFPCGLHDCLAAYLYLLTVQPPETIILSGDSAGGGMIVSLMVMMRDQGLPLPAGSVLISPWVDLTHSFPSVAGDNDFDYVPPYGFLQRPSLSWPPPDSDDLKLLDDDGNDETPESKSTKPGRGVNLRITIDGKLVELKDQIQMYTTNALIGHPLVSPILQPTLGGLPPMLILTGGGEMLRDEQIYLAHKAAAPATYPSPLASKAPYADSDIVHKYPPTNVQLQVWDDLCHVTPTLSFTRPAKHMYRSVAQFSAWALARAQNAEIRILDDDEVSIISSTSSDATDSEEKAKQKAQKSDERRTRKDDMDRSGAVLGTASTSTLGASVGKAGDALPPFVSHMIRQRVTRNGELYPLAPPSELPACQMAVADIGMIKPGPVRKWLAQQKVWNAKYARQKKRVQELRLKELKNNKNGGFVGADANERPPPTALAGRRQDHLPKIQKRRKAMGLAIWSGWGSKHDEDALDKQSEKDKNGEEVVGETNVVAKGKDGMGGAANLDVATKGAKSKSRSRVRAVSYQGQTGAREAEAPTSIDSVMAGGATGAAAATAAAVVADGKLESSSKTEQKAGEKAEETPAKTVPAAESITTPTKTRPGETAVAATDGSPETPETLKQTISVAEQSTIRPAVGEAAFPFKLAQPTSGERNASMITLQSHPGVIEESKQTGDTKTDGDEATVKDLEDDQLTPKKPIAAAKATSPTNTITPATAREETTETTTVAAAVAAGGAHQDDKANDVKDAAAAAAPTATGSTAGQTVSLSAVSSSREAEKEEAVKEADSISISSETPTPAATSTSNAYGFDYGAETETDGSLTPKADDVPTVFNGEVIQPGEGTKRPEMTRFVTADEEIEKDEQETAAVAANTVGDEEQEVKA